MTQSNEGAVNDMPMGRATGVPAIAARRAGA